MSTIDNTATTQDVYSRVTSQIINAIEKGAGTFEMPWHCKDIAFSPVSINGLRPYRGINTVALWATSKERGYSSGLWGTYRNWQEIGGQVRKGEKAALVVYWGTVSNSDDEENETRPHLFCKGYSVFNLAQVDGVKLPDLKAKPLNERISQADEFFSALPGQLNHGYNQAFYQPSTDEICMPDFDQFKQAHGYYSTLAHEYTHWTAPESRMNRQLGKRFGDNVYAAEELIAELGSAYLCAHLQLEQEPRKDHAAYIESWLKVLKSDKRAIFTAASQAQKACDYLNALAKAKGATATAVAA
jgi:antirestriction protein ArdC